MAPQDQLPYNYHTLYCRHGGQHYLSLLENDVIIDPESNDVT